MPDAQACRYSRTVGRHAPIVGEGRTRTSTEAPITQLLSRAAGGSASAASDLLVMVYDELHAIARAMFADQRAGGTLQPTALVHEAYLRLVRQDVDWSSRSQFFVIASKAMRSILVDHARGRGRDKRGGGWRRVALTVADETPSPAESGPNGVPIEAIDAALTALAELDERKARLVELRFFGGLSSEQAAEVLGISRSTAAEDWRTARAWLHQRLQAEGT